MKRFQFKLSTVKKLRELQLDQCLRTYSQAIERRKIAEQRIEILEAKLQQHQVELADVRSGTSFGVGVQDVWQSGQSHILRTIEQVGSELRKLREEEHQAREAFFKARMEVKSIERLEDKDQKEHLREGERAEELELEDMINARRNI